MREDKCAGVLVRALERIGCGGIRVTMPGGEVREFAGEAPGPAADIELRDWRVVANAARRGDVAFAEDYRDGLWDSGDLPALVEFVLRNDRALGALIYGGRLHRLVARALRVLRANTRGGSRRNIFAHYDLGNDFYGAWLDPSMTYSSALFRAPGEPLADGQRNKLDRILDIVGDRPQSLLEIGCGWGSFIERAVGRRGHRVTGITISRAQAEYAERRLASLREGASVRLTDYRDVGGRHDAVVSIEMFEAVGERHWDTYFRKVGESLAPGGVAVVQTILIGDEHFDDYRGSGDTIRRHIFPGGMLPSPSRFEGHARRAGLAVAGIRNFGRDYARTLRLWQRRFDAAAGRVRALGFDDRFVRLWRYYLASCAGAFSAGRTDVAQYELRHGG